MSATTGGVKQESNRLSYVGIGSNLGDRLQHLRSAVNYFREEPGVHVRGISSVYESEAHTLGPGDEAPNFLNAVIAIASEKSPEGLLEDCLRAERRAGRDRRTDRKWAPRTLDCDLLVVGEEVRDAAGLQLPHPRLHERRFVLEPLADLAPNLYIPPPHDATVRELLARCTDPGRPRRLSMPLYPSFMTDA